MPIDISSVDVKALDTLSRSSQITVKVSGTPVSPLSDLGMDSGGDDRPVVLDGTEGMIDGSSGEPSSMHDQSMSHRVWAH